MLHLIRNVGMGLTIDRTVLAAAEAREDQGSPFRTAKLSDKGLVGVCDLMEQVWTMIVLCPREIWSVKACELWRCDIILSVERASSIKKERRKSCTASRTMTKLDRCV